MPTLPVKQKIVSLGQKLKKTPFDVAALVLLCAVLFVVMLLLSGYYLNLRVNGTSSTLPEIPAKDRWIMTGSAYAEKTGTKSLLSPYFMGIKFADGSQCAATFDTSARQSLSAMLDASLESLLTGELKHISLPTQADRRAYAAELCAAERYTFYALFGELPAAALLPALHNGDATGPVENFFVKYIFLLPDEQNFVYAVMLDAALNAVCLYPREDLPYNADSLYSIRETKGYAGFSFTDGLPHSVVFTESFDVASVVIMPSSAFYSYQMGEDKTDKLLKTLGFNTGVTKCVRTGDGSAINFVDEKRELYVDLDNASMTFSAGGDGLHLSDFLGYYPDNDSSYSFADRILGVKYLLGSMDRLLVGGDATPAFVGTLGKENGVTVFYLKYFYNGVMLTDKSYDIAVEMKADAVMSFTATTLFCDSGYMTKPVLPQTLTLPLFSTEASEMTTYYAMFENDASTNQVKLVWVAAREGEGKSE